MHHLITDTESNLELFFLTIGATGFSDRTVRQWKAGMAKLREKQRRGAGEGGAVVNDEHQRLYWVWAEYGLAMPGNPNPARLSPTTAGVAYASGAWSALANVQKLSLGHEPKTAWRACWRE